MNQIVQEIIDQHRKTYNEVFLQHPRDFHQPIYHYDWWMFPQKVPVNANVTSTSRKYSISDEDTIALLEDSGFTEVYLKAIGKYLDNLTQYGWNDYDIRYAKMLHSLDQFILISDQIKEQKNLQQTHVALKQLATRAVQYAEQNIQQPSSLLSAGLVKLNDHLGRASQPHSNNTNSGFISLLLLATGLMACGVSIVLFSLSGFAASLCLMGLGFYVCHDMNNQRPELRAQPQIKQNEQEDTLTTTKAFTPAKKVSTDTAKKSNPKDDKPTTRLKKRL